MKMLPLLLLCLCFLQCHSLAEAWKELSKQQTGGQQEEPQPAEDDVTEVTDNGRQRKSVD